MLKNRLFLSYFTTTVMYILMIGLFFYAQNRYLVSSKQSEEKSIQLCMSAFQPEVATPVEQVQQEEVEEEKEEPEPEEEPEVEEKPEVEPEVVEKPVEEKKPEIKEEVVPEPVVPKPVVKKVEKKPEVKKKPEKKPTKKVVKKKKAKKKQVRQKASSRKVKVSQAQKNQFLANIRTKINKHKSYPRIAKKRGMQGTVNVKFTILKSGKVGNISVSGPKAFHKSARKAVESAFPISVKNAPMTLPQSVHIKLRYQLR